MTYMHNLLYVIITFAFAVLHNFDTIGWATFLFLTICNMLTFINHPKCQQLVTLNLGLIV